MTSSSPSSAAQSVEAQSPRGTRPPESVSDLSLSAYAAPVVGSHFFQSPMWSILPGIYGKYFGLELTAIATVILLVRLFDAVIDPTIGYSADWHRARGGSRKPWVVAGNLLTILVCYVLFIPPAEVTFGFYLFWACAFFLAYTIGEIPHQAWGSELTTDYLFRARVFAFRNVANCIASVAFYMLPLLPFYATSEYTPQVLRDAVLVGAILTVVGLAVSMFAPSPRLARGASHGDSTSELLRSIVRNRPLLVYFAAYITVGIAGGMWYGLVYIYLDSYLGVGDRFSFIFMLALILTALSTPLWVKLINRTSKSTAWGIGVALFMAQLLATLFVTPGNPWWTALLLVIVAHIFFIIHDLSASSMLGDIVAYGILKFGKDRGATYFGSKYLFFKIGLGLGGALSLGIAGLAGFAQSDATHSAHAIRGLKLGFIVLPFCFAALSLFFILRTPIDPRRYRIIQRRLQSRAARQKSLDSAAYSATSPMNLTHDNG